jgi:hypothetical protein
MKFEINSTNTTAHASVTTCNKSARLTLNVAGRNRRRGYTDRHQPAPWAHLEKKRTFIHSVPPFQHNSEHA